MNEQDAIDQGLPPVQPDAGETGNPEQIDNVIPSSSYEKRMMVGLGGSAGSISVLQEFFRLVPVDTGMIFVVVVHLSPEHESSLAEILQRSTEMPVIQVRESMRVLPNTVYVISPGKFLSAEDGMLKQSDQVSPLAARTSIDLFFRSMADVYGAHALGIVLSGVGGDGALGIKRLKERGGLTIAQDPDEAEQDGMPRAAIATGMVDWVLRVQEMPARLQEFVRLERRLRVPPEDGPHPQAAPRSADNELEAALRDVLTHLRTRTGRDFSYYKRATILRRISRRLQVNGLVDITAYLTYLRTHAGEAGALLQDLLISVTNFFRDRDAFQALERVIPTLFQGKGNNDPIRVWVPACATGEEAYSIAILLCEHARTLETAPPIQVFATDLDEEVIQTARDGIYPETIAADVSEERLRRYFVKEHRGYRVRREIREMVLFAVHDLLKDSPFSRLDLISCRNLLIYLNRDAQVRAFDIFHFALRRKGKLFLGSSESVDEEEHLFNPLDKKHRLYVHRDVARTGLPIPSGPSTLALSREGRTDEGPVIFRPAFDSESIVTALRGQATDRTTTWGEIHYKLIERFAPPSLLVDSNYDILHLSESAGRFLQFAGGEPTQCVLRLIHPLLRLELRAALYRASQPQANNGPQAQRVVGIPVEINGSQEFVTIHVKPADDVCPSALLVVFESHPVAVASGDPPLVRYEAEPVTRDLERELERLKSHLRDIVEQYEASTEELKAGNEELQAMNEELRSATEELETSREELQSINEELTTVNQELKSKVDELGNANSDLHNLMASTAIATVFLDRDLRITRFTPRAVDIFRLIPTDIGRPLSDLSHRLKYTELQSDAASVLETLLPVERKVNDHGDHWYLARMLPYRTVEDRIGGVVLTFVDVTEQNQAEELARETGAEFQAIFELSSVGMAQADPHSGRLLRANRRLSGILGYSRETLETMTIGELTYPPDRPANMEQMARLVAGDVSEFSMEKRLVCSDGRPIWIHENVTLMRDRDGHPKRTVAVILDITERKAAEEALRQSEERLRNANQELELRVSERTRNLQESEARLKDVATTAKERAEQLQQLTVQLSKVENEERRRLAAVLHDHVQQILVAAKMRVDLAISDVSDPTLVERLTEANRMLDESITAARLLSIELAPPLLHDQGLAATLEWLAGRMQEMHRLTVHTRVNPVANPSSDEKRDVLFQAARELLLNVVKHARVQEATMTLSKSGRKTKLEVVDNGVGFDVSKLSSDPQSFGHFHILERIRGLGGTFKVTSKPGQGTKATIILG